jgi:DNA-binding transcriptional ArsR family regulator
MRIYAYMSEKAARIFSVLSDPVRLQILFALAKKGCCVAILQDETGRNQPNISQHLRVLRESGLVASRREGRKIRYSLANDDVKELVKLVEKVRI